MRIAIGRKINSTFSRLIINILHIMNLSNRSFFNKVLVAIDHRLLLQFKDTFSALCMVNGILCSHNEIDIFYLKRNLIKIPFYREIVGRKFAYQIIFTESSRKIMLLTECASSHFAVQIAISPNGYIGGIRVNLF